MRILACSIDFRPQEGGISTFASEVVQALEKQDDEVIVVAPKTEGQEEFDRNCSTEIIRTDFAFGRMEKGLRDLFQELRNLYVSFRLFRRVIRERKIDCILCFHWRIFGPVSLVLSRLTGVKFFLVGHGMELAPYRHRAVRRRPRSRALKNLLANVIMELEAAVRRVTFRGADKVFSVSNFTTEMLENLGVNRGGITVTNCGVRTEEFNPYRGHNGILAKHGIEGKRVVLSLTRLIPRKGLDYSIRAFPEVLKSVEDAVYLIAGQGTYENELRQIADEENLNGNVIFAGYVPDSELPDYYNACDVFLLPCRERPGGDVEGFGIVFLEANACQKPVIGGRSGGAAEAVDDQYSGILVNPKSEMEISRAVVRLLTDSKLSHELGFQGRARVLERFTWDSVAARFHEGMNDAVRANGNGRTLHF